MSTEDHHQQQHPNRNAEIWSTRLQKELLALTTDNADDQSTDEVRTMIPPFVRVQDHHLDLEQGVCLVNFAIEVVTKSAARSDLLHTVVVTMDASLPPGTLRGATAATLNATTPTPLAYPFVAPRVLLKSGAGCFPAFSTIRDGDMVPMDIDWTPSLHLTDAVMNISLKVKESIIQGEPFHPVPNPPHTPTGMAAAGPFAEGNFHQQQQQQHHPVDDLAQGARRLATSFTKGATNLTKGATSSITKAFSTSGATGAGSSVPKKNSAGNNKKLAKTTTTTAATTTGQDIKIGDEINLLEEPWVEARGVYSCKAIRRPKFVTDAMELAQQQAEQKAFHSPTAMFRSFAKSARGVLEESFLMVTQSHIIELKASKLNLSVGTVAFCIPVEMLAKLKFRRQESLSLFFKPAPEEPLIYMCPDSADAVHQIQAVLKEHGVRGKHTNAAAFRAINEAMQLIQEIQTKEMALKHDPTVSRVNEIMDLYRQAAERFEGAGDLRHEEVVTHMRKFLALPLTISILDGSFKNAQPTPSKQPKSNNVTSTDQGNSVPEGEVLESFHALVNADENDPSDVNLDVEKEKDKEFVENIDNLLKEAKEGFQNFPGDSTNLDMTEASTLLSESDDMALADVVSDLDAMMRQADKELAELMKA